MWDCCPRCEYLFPCLPLFADVGFAAERAFQPPATPRNRRKKHSEWIDVACLQLLVRRIMAGACTQQNRPGAVCSLVSTNVRRSGIFDLPARRKSVLRSVSQVLSVGADTQPGLSIQLLDIHLCIGGSQPRQRNFVLSSDAGQLRQAVRSSWALADFLSTRGLICCNTGRPERAIRLPV